MGTQLPSPKREQSPPFSVHFYCGQMDGWIKMPLGMEVGLSAGDFVLDGDPAPLPKKGRSPPIFGPCLLWPNGCMDQDALGMEAGLGLRDIVLDHRWGPSSPSPKGSQCPPQFSANVHCGQTAGWTKMPLGRGRPRPRQLCVRWGPSYRQKKGHTHLPPNFWPMSIVANRLDG